MLWELAGEDKKSEYLIAEVQMQLTMQRLPHLELLWLHFADFSYSEHQVQTLHLDYSLHR
jgi:hypothetical protein